MTKDWEAVKADICRYYAEGKPLIQVQELLLTEKSFKASIRAYRLKVAEWNIKRPRKFLQKPHASTPPEDANDDHGERVVISLVSDDERSPSPVPEASTASTTNSVAHGVPHGRQDITSPCLCKAKELEDLLQQTQRFLHDTKHPPPLGLVVNRHTFLDGVDNILHFATRTPERPRIAYDRIVATLTSFKFPFNARDCNGMTALEIAVRTYDREAVKILLSAGALPSICSIAGETLLHISMLHFPSYQITAEILPQLVWKGIGEDPEPYEVLCRQAIRLACSTIGDSIEPIRLADSYRMLSLTIERCVVLAAVELSAADINLAFKTLVETWEQHAQLLSKGCLRATALHSCRVLLQQGANIFQTTDRHPPHRRWRHLDRMPNHLVCETLADLANFHLPDDAPAIAIAENHSPEYGEPLARNLMDPCPLRLSSSDSDAPQALLRRALARQAGQPRVVPNLLLFALETAPTSLKYGFVQAILECDKEARTIAKPAQAGYWSTLVRALVHVEESLRWRISELIFAYDGGLRSVREDGTRARVSGYYSCPALDTDSAYVDRLCQDAIILSRRLDGINLLQSSLLPRAFCRHCASSHYWIEDSQGTKVYEFQRCAIHVITKMMLDEGRELGQEMSVKARVARALRLRGRFNLPDIAIDGSLLLEAISTLH